LQPFGDHLRVCGQRRPQRGLVRGQAFQPGQDAPVGQQAVGGGHAQVAQQRAVGKVALQAGDRQPPGEQAQQRVGHFQVAFRVLELDRVDLVRHGRGADFPRHHPLHEEAIADVAPHVLAEIEQDAVAAGQGVQDGDQMIARLDLGRDQIRAQAQAGHELPAEGDPVHVRAGGDVGVEVARRPVELTRQGGDQPGQRLPLPPQPEGEDADFLAQRGRAGRLAVSTG